MAHTFLKAEKIVDTTIALLETELVLGNTVWNYGDLDWSSAKDDTITLRLPAVLTAREYEWRTRNNPIVFDDLTETSYDISIGGHVYSAVKVTDEQLTLDIKDFGSKVLAPQAKAVAKKLEANIVNVLTGLPFKTVVQLDAAGDGTVGDTTSGTTSVTTAVRNDPHAALVAARKYLNRSGVPFDGRFVVIGSDMEEAFLTAPQLVKVDESGSSSALRDATIGRLAGFTIVVSAEIDPAEGFAYHRSAVGMAQMAPAVPSGATAGATLARDGFAMRWIRDYDANFLTDRSVVSAFYGVQGINDGPNVDLDGAGAGIAEASNIRAVKLELV